MDLIIIGSNLDRFPGLWSLQLEAAVPCMKAPQLIELEASEYMWANGHSDDEQTLLPANISPCFSIQANKV